MTPQFGAYLTIVNYNQKTFIVQATGENGGEKKSLLRLFVEISTLWLSHTQQLLVVDINFLEMRFITTRLISSCLVHLLELRHHCFKNDHNNILGGFVNTTPDCQLEMKDSIPVQHFEPKRTIFTFPLLDNKAPVFDSDRHLHAKPKFASKVGGLPCKYHHRMGLW